MNEQERGGLRLGDMVSEYTPDHRAVMPWYRHPQPAPVSPESIEDRGGLRVGL
jgi:hypothetical protein